MNYLYPSAVSNDRNRNQAAMNEKPLLLNNRHIFIVEDNLENRVIFQMSLIKQGAIVDFERWGRDAVRRVKASSHIDLIVLDLMLKDGKSGLDLCDEIRALPRFASIPIVAVSAMDPSVAIPNIRTRKFNGFIAKPIDSRLFPKQIYALLEGQHVWYYGEGVRF
jgi:CheY-like chemotaxis protein